jgi:hypothetical protein
MDDRTFYDRFTAELDNLMQSRGLLDRSKALLFWFATNHLHMDDEDDTKTRISDGSNDEGIDGIFVDTDEKVIYLVNATTVDVFENSRNNLPETDLKIMFEGFRLVTLGDYRGKVNPILENLVAEYHELLNSGEGYKVKVIFVHLNVRPTSTKYVEEFRREFNTVSVDFVDFDGLRQSYENYLVYQEEPPSRVPLEVIGSILENNEIPKSIIFTISGKTLANTFLTHKTRIFLRNVRYFLVSRSKKSINAQIEKTASDPVNSKNFWYYNNGITIVCSKAEVPPNKRVVILDKMQIINGAQTTYAIVKAYDENRLQDATKVLVKVIESSDNDFMDDVTLYTNSQNPVNLRDLTSKDEIQTRIQRTFKIYRYFYERKRGEFNAIYTTDEIKSKEFGTDWKNRIIANERAAQAYLAMFLNKPAQAKSQKRRIFIKGDGGFYNDIFTEDLIEERMLMAYKLLEFIEARTDEYSDRYYSISGLTEAQLREIYKYDFLLHSDFFLIDLFADFLLSNGFALDREGCKAIIQAIENNDSRIHDIYNTINELLLEFIVQRRAVDPTYYHNKFFKSDGSIDLVRTFLHTEKKMEFVRLLS